MSERDAYVQKIKAQLDHWNAEIDKLEAKSQEASADAQIEYREQIDTLKQRRQEITEKLAALKTAGDSAWEDMKSGVELAWNAMDSALRSAVSRFR